MRKGFYGLSSLSLGMVMGSGIGESHETSIHKSPLPKYPLGKKVVNPYNVTEDFLSKGKDLYQRTAFCAGCHGPEWKRQWNEFEPL